MADTRHGEHAGGSSPRTGKQSGMSLWERRWDPGTRKGETPMTGGASP